MSTPRRLPSTCRPTPIDPAQAARLIPWSAMTYVLVWIIGLAIAPNQVSNEAGTAAVQEHYAAQGLVVAAQATLVHAVAGIALAVLSTGVAAATHPGRARELTVAAGEAAAVVSVSQAVLAYAAVVGATDHPAAWSLTMLHIINMADAVKLLLLSVFVLGSCVLLRRAGSLPRWIGQVGLTVALLLPLGAAYFIVALPPLYAALCASLVLLLVWVGAVGVNRMRATRTSSALAASLVR